MKNYQLKINGQEFDVQIDELAADATKAGVVVNGVEYEVEIQGEKPSVAQKPQVAPDKSVVKPAATTATPVAAPAAAPRRAAAGGTVVACPLPGTVLSLKVAVGDSVTAGQTVVILEAMKMENNINADCAGIIKEICVQQGASVMEGDTLMVIG